MKEIIGLYWQKRSIANKIRNMLSGKISKPYKIDNDKYLLDLVLISKPKYFGLSYERGLRFYPEANPEINHEKEKVTSVEITVFEKCFLNLARETAEKIEKELSLSARIILDYLQE